MFKFQDLKIFVLNSHV